MHLPALISGPVLTPISNLYVAYPWNALGGPPGPANVALTDVTQVFHPTLLYAAREVRAGRFPFWNPYQYAGTPFLGNPQTATLFPLTGLAYLLPAWLAITLIALAKLVIAGLATYWCLRTALAVGPPAALVGALGFMLSSTLIGWLHWTFASTMIFLPPLFGVVARLRDHDGARWLGALGLVAGLAMLAGYPQAAFHAFLAAGAWALALARGPGGARFLVRCAAGMALGTGLAAVQILPALDYVLESAVYAYRSQWTPSLHVPVSAAITFLMPVFYGTGAATWSTWQFNITSTYVGVVPVLALPLAFVGGARRRGTWFFLALALVAAAVHYGAPLAASLANAPGMSLGTNLRLMPLLAFAICVLGAIGVDEAVAAGAGVKDRVVRGWFVVLVAAALITVAFHLAEPRAQAMSPSLALQFVALLAALTAATLVLARRLRGDDGRWTVALVALQLLSLAPLAMTYNTAVERRWLYPTTPALRWLSGHAGDGRVLLPGHVGLLYGLREAHGYDGLGPRRIVQVVGTVGTGAAPADGFLENTVALHGSEPLSPATVFTSAALDLLGVRWIVLPPQSPALRPGLSLAYDGPDARVFENPRALPRAFVVGRARCEDDHTALALVRGGAVDLRREAVLGDCAVPPGQGGGAGTAEIRHSGTDRLVVSVSTNGGAWLVVTDTWFPGWRVSIDGRDAPLLRADHAFRAVKLAAGRHEVEFRFRPPRLALGVAISALSSAAILALVLWRPPPRRRLTMPRARLLAALALALTVLTFAPRARAVLPAPPIDLEVTPSRVADGEAVTLRLVPRGRGPAGPYDIYIVWARSERAAFLAPDGLWSPRPVPYRASLTVTGELSATWPRPGPPGEVPLALLVLPPGAPPLDRAEWRFGPGVATLTVVPAASPADTPWLELVGLAVVALLACALVLLDGRAGGALSGSRSV